MCLSERLQAGERDKNHSDILETLSLLIRWRSMSAISKRHPSQANRSPTTGIVPSRKIAKPAMVW
jgi:hypothetical protein